MLRRGGRRPRGGGRRPPARRDPGRERPPGTASRRCGTPRSTVWTYGGTVPGPLLEARAGDRVIVRFLNELPEEATIHWHGLRVPNAMDGVPAMQAPVPPGGTFDYAFVVPDAGLFWYHPHVRSDEQVERGLYGAIRVRGEDEPELGRERVLVLDDVLVDEAGALASFEYDPAMAAIGPPAELRRIDPLPAPVRTRVLRFGEQVGGGGGEGEGEHGAHGGGAAGGPVFTINGEAFPDITPLEAELGAVEEWTLINESEMDHPFHLHGFFFQVLSRGGVPEPLAWKDTVNLRAEEALVLRVRFDDHPGRWMYHCHILEHAERGMLGEIDVRPPEGG